MTDDPSRELVTPEGVPLRFALAQVGDRLGAFLIDATLLIGATVVVFVLTGLLVVATRGIGLAIAFLFFFVVRSFYFTWFECLWQGATPGKRLLGLRVIDARGGILTPEAVFARNLMREVESFLPLVALLAPDALLPGIPAGFRPLAFGWLFVFALLPLFNRDHLRVGDLVGGTLVVRAPRTDLREDLSAPGTVPAASQPDLSFTTEQLDLYGIHELHVLESLLRQAQPNPATLHAVARQIQHKIGWAAPAGPPIASGVFLRAFYSAQRARLEQRLLFGERREKKRAGRLIRRP